MAEASPDVSGQQVEYLIDSTFTERQPLAKVKGWPTDAVGFKLYESGELISTGYVGVIIGKAVEISPPSAEFLRVLPPYRVCKLDRTGDLMILRENDVLIHPQSLQLMLSA